MNVYIAFKPDVWYVKSTKCDFSIQITNSFICHYAGYSTELNNDQILIKFPADIHAPQVMNSTEFLTSAVAILALPDSMLASAVAMWD